MIRVFGFRRFFELQPSGPVVLRSAELRDLLPADALADREILLLDSRVSTVEADTIERLATHLSEISTARDLNYLSVGTGCPADVILDAAGADLIAETFAAPVNRGAFGLGSCQIVDALALAVAERRRPFDRGLAHFDPTIPLVVTNWYGDDVVELAADRLMRVYGAVALPKPTSDFELLIDAQEHLTETSSVAGLEHITARLRRDDGCPWDREQTRESLFPQFQEELEELGAAIRSGDVANQREELGDVLFHVIAQCQVASEAGDFTFDDVVRDITAKLLRRHPHVFGDLEVDSIEAVLDTWQRVKQEEKYAAGKKPTI